MLNIIEEMEKQKAEHLQKAEDHFAQAHRIESALALLREEPKPKKTTTNSKDTPFKRGKAGISPTKNIVYGQRVRLISEHAERFCKAHNGAATIVDIRKSLVEAGLFKRGKKGTSPSTYLNASKKFFFDAKTQMWTLKTPLLHQSQTA